MDSAEANARLQAWRDADLVVASALTAASRCAVAGLVFELRLQVRGGARASAMLSHLARLQDHEGREPAVLIQSCRFGDDDGADGAVAAGPCRQGVATTAARQHGRPAVLIRSTFAATEPRSQAMGDAPCVSPSSSSSPRDRGATAAAPPSPRSPRSEPCRSGESATSSRPDGEVGVRTGSGADSGGEGRLDGGRNGGGGGGSAEGAEGDGCAGEGGAEGGAAGRGDAEGRALDETELGWARKVALDASPCLVTVMKHPGVVLYQNAQSQSYFGDMRGQEASPILWLLLGNGGDGGGGRGDGVRRDAAAGAGGAVGAAAETDAAVAGGGQAEGPAMLEGALEALSVGQGISAVVRVPGRLLPADGGAGAARAPTQGDKTADPGTGLGASPGWWAGPAYARLSLDELRRSVHSVGGEVGSRSPLMDQVDRLLLADLESADSTVGGTSGHSQPTRTARRFPRGSALSGIVDSPSNSGALFKTQQMPRRLALATAARLVPSGCGAAGVSGGEDGSASGSCSRALLTPGWDSNPGLRSLTDVPLSEDAGGLDRGATSAAAPVAAPAAAPAAAPVAAPVVGPAAGAGTPAQGLARGSSLPAGRLWLQTATSGDVDSSRGAGGDGGNGGSSHGTVDSTAAAAVEYLQGQGCTPFKKQQPPSAEIMAGAAVNPVPATASATAADSSDIRRNSNTAQRNLAPDATTSDFPATVPAGKPLAPQFGPGFNSMGPRGGFRMATSLPSGYNLGVLSSPIAGGASLSGDGGLVPARGPVCGISRWLKDNALTPQSPFTSTTAITSTSPPVQTSTPPQPSCSMPAMPSLEPGRGLLPPSLGCVTPLNQAQPAASTMQRLLEAAASARRRMAPRRAVSVLPRHACSSSGVNVSGPDGRHSPCGGPSEASSAGREGGRGSLMAGGGSSGDRFGRKGGVVSPSSSVLPAQVLYPSSIPQRPSPLSLPPVAASVSVAVLTTTDKGCNPQQGRVSPGLNSTAGAAAAQPLAVAIRSYSMEPSKQSVQSSPDMTGAPTNLAMSALADTSYVDASPLLDERVAGLDDGDSSSSGNGGDSHGSSSNRNSGDSSAGGMVGCRANEGGAATTAVAEDCNAAASQADTAVTEANTSVIRPASLGSTRPAAGTASANVSSGSSSHLSLLPRQQPPVIPASAKGGRVGSGCGSSSKGGLSLLLQARGSSARGLNMLDSLARHETGSAGSNTMGPENLMLSSIASNFVAHYISEAGTSKDGNMMASGSHDMSAAVAAVTASVTGLAMVSATGLAMPEASLGQWRHQEPTGEFTIGPYVSGSMAGAAVMASTTNTSGGTSDSRRSWAGLPTFRLADERHTPTVRPFTMSPLAKPVATEAVLATSAAGQRPQDPADVAGHDLLSPFRNGGPPNNIGSMDSQRLERAASKGMDAAVPTVTEITGATIATTAAPTTMAAATAAISAAGSTITATRVPVTEQMARNPRRCASSIAILPTDCSVASNPSTCSAHNPSLPDYHHQQQLQQQPLQAHRQTRKPPQRANTHARLRQLMSSFSSELRPQQQPYLPQSMQQHQGGGHLQESPSRPLSSPAYSKHLTAPHSPVSPPCSPGGSNTAASVNTNRQPVYGLSTFNELQGGTATAVVATGWAAPASPAPSSSRLTRLTTSVVVSSCGSGSSILPQTHHTASYFTSCSPGLGRLATGGAAVPAWDVQAIATAAAVSDPTADTAEGVAWHQIHIRPVEGGAASGHNGIAAGAGSRETAGGKNGGGCCSSQLLVVTQVDVTAQVLEHRPMARLLQKEHKVLESIFPRHCIEYLTAVAGCPSGVSEAPLLAARGSSIGRPSGGALGLAGSSLGGGGDAAMVGALSPLASYTDGATRLASLATAHACVSILFCDCVGFTSMCHSASPFTVMSFLNDLYSRFDSLVDIYKVYKVETIGDCYMVAGGLVAYDEDGYKSVISGTEDPLHAVRTMEFAKAILRVSREVRLPHNGQPVQLRVGLHSGPVTSGVVGERMPRFCLFGDTVNVASRMESTCRPGCIHVSAATHSRLPSEPWRDLGMTAVKGKGDMRTYEWAGGDGEEAAQGQQLSRLLGLYL